MATREAPQGHARNLENWLVRILHWHQGRHWYGRGGPDQQRASRANGAIRQPDRTRHFRGPHSPHASRGTLSASSCVSHRQLTVTLGPRRETGRPPTLPPGRNQMPRKAPIISVTKAWSSACGSPDTVTVPTTPTSLIRIGKAPPCAAKSRGSTPRASSSAILRAAKRLAYEIGSRGKSVDDVDFALDPRVVLGRGARQRDVEQLLAMAPDVNGDRQRPLDRDRHHRAAEPPRVLVAEPGEDQLFLLGLERGDERLLVVVHAFPRACASTVSTVSMIKMVSSCGISGLSASPAPGRRATSSAPWRRPRPSWTQLTPTGPPFLGMSVAVAGA